MLSLYPLTRAFYNNIFFYCLKIFIVMSGVVIIPMAMTGSLQLPPILGAVAAALTDLDDHIKNRIKNIGLILLLFFIASVLVEILMPHPVLFFLLCAFGTTLLMMFRALGERFATLAFGTLVISVYAMLTFDAERAWYLQPLMLLSGALWFHLISLPFHFIWPARPVTDSLAHCYRELAAFLELKARFFDPDEVESIESLKLKLSIAGKQLTMRLNQTREVIMRRLRLQRDADTKLFPELLNAYLTAQSLYERASSVHVDYLLLHEKFRYSDLLFRFQRLMMQQGSEARTIAMTLTEHQDYHYSNYLARLTLRLEETITQLETTHEGEDQEIDTLRHLLHNLSQINLLLSKLERSTNREKQNPLDSHRLEDLRHNLALFLPEQVATLSWKNRLKAHIERLKMQLTPESEIYRHAIRMGFVMGVGYLIILLGTGIHQYLFPDTPMTTRIFWIVLTAIFVCQPNYSATKTRILKRLSGTIAGVVITILFLELSPSIPLQALVVIASGTLFFALSAVRYSFATALITIMILIGFNLNDYGFIAPERLIDTLIGCAIAWIASHYILPDWRYYNVPASYSKAANANCEYLAEIRTQYHQGRNDSLAYITSRMRANDADSELSLLFSALSDAKQQSHEAKETLFHNLCLNSTFLGYLSALGAHRNQIQSPELLTTLDQVTDFIINALQNRTFDKAQYSALKALLAEQLQTTQQPKQKNQQTHEKAIERLLLQQLHLLLRSLPSYLRALFNV
ncbi:TIGR01666 family membrane protein [Ignatzschineria ureiclastica]|uniref:TIGR01666 family membrane protein n=1 Tax=Ignatzschineria ureiclastica TaxID=472582 RepID=A0A2U2AFE3_9GAMM|nr:YccS family putative transporter [Ignatzschineria ureiclastica]PWD81373.1 TIGR01666 family membrane protein [Ignatzschineria ureiclastica]GGZ98368.1 membrane protein [Ignatzschineria ureiclastica]